MLGKLLLDASGFIPPLPRGTGSFIPPISQGTGWKTYVPWDVDLLYGALNQVKENIGAGFNIGIWIFLIVTGIYIVFKVVDGFGK